MRHRKSIKKLGRTAAHRKATLANLSAALFERKHIKTTEAKAKEARRVSEKLITLAKKDTVHARRMALKKLRHKKIVHILFNDIAPQYTDRMGGYTRVIKLGQREGDGARMAVLELVGFEMASKKKKAKEKEKEAKSDTKKSKKAKSTEKAEEPVKVEKPKEEVKKKTTSEKKTAAKAKDKEKKKTADDKKAVAKTDKKEEKTETKKKKKN
ncbi:50S ribosomal protein L17 [bacterium]